MTTPLIPFTPKGGTSQRVTATAKASPLQAYVPDYTSRGGRPHYCTQIILTNDQTSGDDIPAFAGIRRAADGGGANWQPFLTGLLGPCESVWWEGEEELQPGDDIVAYAGTTNLIVCRFQISQVTHGLG